MKPSKIALLLYVELFVLFFLVPLLIWVIPFVWVKLTTGLIGLAYISFVTYKKGIMHRAFLEWPKTSKFYATIVFKLSFIAVLSILYMFFVVEKSLFTVLSKPLLIIGVAFVYTFFSVIPQEFVYRVYYFQRYGTLFPSAWVLHLCNAVCFSLCHLLFENLLVLVITFVGSFLFSSSWVQTQSLSAISLEHTLYGLTLFIVGLGEMLAFPY